MIDSLSNFPQKLRFTSSNRISITLLYGPKISSLRLTSLLIEPSIIEWRTLSSKRIHSLNTHSQTYYLLKLYVRLSPSTPELLYRIFFCFWFVLPSFWYAVFFNSPYISPTFSIFSPPCHSNLFSLSLFHCLSSSLSIINLLYRLSVLTYFCTDLSSKVTTTRT